MKISRPGLATVATVVAARFQIYRSVLEIRRTKARAAEEAAEDDEETEAEDSGENMRARAAAWRMRIFLLGYDRPFAALEGPSSLAGLDRHAWAAAGVERLEYEYVRHGTLCLSANLDVATGRVESPTSGLTRSEEGFAAHITRTLDTDPDAPASP